MREWVPTACIWGLALSAGLSLWPFRFRRKWQSWNLYLPVAAVALYGLYEIALPQMVLLDRRRVVLGLLFFLCFNGMAKVALLMLLQRRARRRRRHLRNEPQVSLQLLLALPIAAACAGWIWTGIP